MMTMVIATCSFFTNMIHMLEIEDAIACSRAVRYTLAHRSENFRTHRSVVPWTVHDIPWTGRSRPPAKIGSLHEDF